ncbi:MAG: hypothetical protein ACD_12C00439G0007 [uncultured bacterium]|nr:MAG: hypothetical protein ACD_12C00439G0007 [uncultured bacterium]
MKIIDKSVEFEWDKGNIDKNMKHGVEDKESEEIFGSKKKIFMKDEKHSLKEERYMIWGKTKMDRKLTVFFTLRNKKVRIISARDMNRKEKNAYEKKIQGNT